MRKRTVIACSKVGVKVAVCFEAKDEVAACSGTKIEDGKLLSVARESAGPEILGHGDIM
jgi:hypothetical protein